MLAKSIFVLFAIIYYVNSECTNFPEGGARAIAILRGSFNGSLIRGVARFEQLNQTEPIRITLNVTGIPVGLGPNHGLHVHTGAISTWGDDTASICGSAGPHYNPLHVKHSDINSTERHVGDYGNVKSDEHGNIFTKFTDKVSQLYGRFAIIGRTIILHQLEDDFGTKGNNGSLTTGNAGSRIACGVIGILP